MASSPPPSPHPPASPTPPPATPPAPTSPPATSPAPTSPPATPPAPTSPAPTSPPATPPAPTPPLLPILVPKILSRVPSPVELPGSWHDDISPKVGVDHKLSAEGGEPLQQKPRKHAPRLSKIFISDFPPRRKDSPRYPGPSDARFKGHMGRLDLLKTPVIETEREESCEDYSAVPERRRRSYERVAEINKALLAMKIHKFRVNKHHSMSFDPALNVEDPTDNFDHPFKVAHERFLIAHPVSVLERPRMMSMMPKGTEQKCPAKFYVSSRARLPSTIEERSIHSDDFTNPVHSTSSRALSGSLSPKRMPSTTCDLTNLGQLNEEVENSWKSLAPSTLEGRRGRSKSGAAGKEIVGSASASLGVAPPILSGSNHGLSPVAEMKVSPSGVLPSKGKSDHRGSRMSLKTSPFRQRSQTELETLHEAEYFVFTHLSRAQRRKSHLSRQRWKRASNIIKFMRIMGEVIARSSIQKEAHLRTFADIGDEATKGTDKKPGFSLLDSGFRTNKESGEMSISTKVQVLMSHNPSTRTTDEVTLILCDLQCLPSFCTYPLVAQNMIARCGMFQPVDKKRVIVRQGHEPQNWYFVLSGQAIETETKITEEGKENINTVKFVTQGMTIAEDAILKGDKLFYTVTTRRYTQLIRLPKEDFLEFSHRLRGRQTDEIPEHILFMQQQPFMACFPFEVLLKHPSMCCQYYCRPNTVLVTDSELSEWIYVIRSGCCVVQMYVESTKASWRDLELALSHPQVNIDGLPLPGIDSGPGKLPLRPEAHTLFQRMSAQDILASDLNQVPALHMTRGGSKNVHHGLHLLAGEGTMKCPWPLDFFNAMNRTAFSIHLPPEQFPVDPSQHYPSPYSSPEAPVRNRFHSDQESQERKRSTCQKQTVNEYENTTCTTTDSSIHENDNITNNNKKTNQANNNARLQTNPQSQDASSSASCGEDAARKPFLERVFLTQKEEEEERKKRRRRRSKGVGGGGEGTYGREGEDDHQRRQIPGHPVSRKRHGRARDVNTNMETNAEELKASDSVELCEQASFNIPEQASQVLRKATREREREHRLQQGSSMERRRKYRIPNSCKPPPPPPASSWRRPVAPYDCVSPPVYIHISMLTEGDNFGLDQLQEPGHERREQSGKVALISRGAEVVMLNKRFFMSFATDKTHVLIREHMHSYPTQKSVQTRYRLQLAWQLYSKKVQDEFRQQLVYQGKKYTGTYFKESPVEFGDPYNILKEH